MFNIKMKFVTKIWCPIDTAIEAMLEPLGMPVPGVEKDVVHTMTLEHSPVIPDKEWLKNTEKVIFSTMKEELGKKGIKVKGTKFESFTDIEEF